MLTREVDFKDGYRPDISTPGDYTVDPSIDALPLAPEIYSLPIGYASVDSHRWGFLAAFSQIESNSK